MKRNIGLLLILLGVIGNNVVYLQDVILGQGHISLDSWRAYSGIIVSILMILIGCWMLYAASSRSS